MNDEGSPGFKISNKNELPSLSKPTSWQTTNIWQSISVTASNKSHNWFLTILAMIYSLLFRKNQYVRKDKDCLARLLKKPLKTFCTSLK